MNRNGDEDGDVGGMKVGGMKTETWGDEEIEGGTRRYGGGGGGSDWGERKSVIREIEVAIPFRWDKFHVTSDHIQSGAQRISRITSRQFVLDRVFAESTRESSRLYNSTTLYLRERDPTHPTMSHRY